MHTVAQTGSAQEANEYPMAIPKSLISVVDQWRENTLSVIDQRFAAALEQAIPALIERAEKAQSDKLQQAYFEAQLAIGKDRLRLRQRYQTELRARLETTPGNLENRRPSPSGEMKLIKPDIFERLVVLQNLGDRADQQYYSVLHELSHRLSVLHRGAVVRPSHIPASPSQLLSSFDEATKPLAMDHLAWQTLAAVFDISVLRTLQAEYEALNGRLREAGVLPNLKLEAVTSSAAHPYGSASSSQSDTTTSGPSVDNPHGSDLSYIRDLMLTAKPSSNVRGSNTCKPSEIVELIEQQDDFFVQLLPEHEIFSPGVDGINIGEPQLNASRTAIRHQRDMIKTTVGYDKLSRYDETTIDIIGALFEAMLDEAELAAPIKALLCHLHTPYLKLAMQDAELLTNAGHPGRQLLDELVRAGELWGDEIGLGKGIFPTLREIVESLRDGSPPDRNTLERLRTRLLRQTGELRRRYDLRSQRATEAEVGRAKLEQCKAIAETQIHRLLVAESPCQSCQIFLTGPWHGYLTLLLLRNGGKTGSQEWLDSQVLGEDFARLSREVIQSSPPPTQAIDQLGERLTKSLGELAPHYQVQIDAVIKNLHRMRNQKPSDISREQTVTKLSPREHMPKIEKMQTPLTESEQTILEELRNDACGTQYHLRTADGQRTRLLTVTWFNPNTDRILLVDQHGAKAELISVQRMARLIHQKKASPAALERREPFVARALRNLRNYLERNTFITLGGSHDRLE